MKKSSFAAALIAGVLCVVGTGAMAASNAADGKHAGDKTTATHHTKHHAKNTTEHDCKMKHKNDRKGYKSCVQEHKTSEHKPAM
jgi:hypothetical protein